MLRRSSPRSARPAQILALFAALSLCACSDEDPDSSAATSTSSSSGGNTCDAAAEPHGTDPAAGHAYPDITLTDCDGNKVTMDSLRCQHDITLLSIGAGWCQPCIMETPHLQEAFENMASQGAGVVQVMVQDADANAATSLFCDNWTTQFSLTMPVFIDPLASSVEPFALSDVNAALPLNLIMDRDGKVLFSQSGYLNDVEGTLQTYLP